MGIFSIQIFQSRVLVFYLLVKEIFRRIWIRFYIFSINLWPLRISQPDCILVTPPHFHKANQRIVYEIYSGKYFFAGHFVSTNGTSPFQIQVNHLEWNKALHTFSWLYHFHAEGTQLSFAHAHVLIADWIAVHGRCIHFSDPVWDPLVTAKRLIAWLQCFDCVAENIDADFERLFLESIAFQIKYLRMIVSCTPEHLTQFSIRICLLLFALVLSPSSLSLRKEEIKFLEELDVQILPDGCHVSRNPQLLLDLLPDFLSLKETFFLQGELISPHFLNVIDRMFSALRFFQHTDGSIARFNGMGATLYDQISYLLSYDSEDNISKVPVLQFPYAGYQRFRIGETILIADTGSPPSFSCKAHASCLSFELSSAGSNFIVNCGIDHLGSSEYHLLARCTAAHSTAVLNDTSQAKFMDYKGWIRDLIDIPLFGGANHITCRRIDTSDSQGFIGRHNAYVQSHGLFHEREIHLSDRGNFLTGVDRFFLDFHLPFFLKKSNQVILRFHLHPDIEIGNIQENKIALVARSGECWTFMTQDVPVMIEESIFFASPNGPRATRQIILIADLSEISVIQWKMQRDSV